MVVCEIDYSILKENQYPGSATFKNQKYQEWEFLASLEDLFSIGISDWHLNKEFTVSIGFYNTFSKIYEEIQLCFIDHQNYLEAPALNLWGGCGQDPLQEHQAKVTPSHL